MDSITERLVYPSYLNISSKYFLRTFDTSFEALWLGHIKRGKGDLLSHSC